MNITRDEVDGWRQRIGRAGVWLPGTARRAGPELGEAAATMERLGYGALWIGGGNSDGQAFSDLTALLRATGELVVASGIANIWAWEPASLHATVAAIDRAYPDRFVLGLGVAHPHIVGDEYKRPLSAMRDFLDGLDRAAAEEGNRRPPFRVLAALRDRMLELARDRSGGAHPYLMPPEHTAAARRVLGDGALLAPELAVVLETDPVRARAIGREYMAYYFGMPNYMGQLRSLGFGDEDFSNGASDRLVDAIVAWGSVDDIAARVHEHLEAGADHVAIQPVDGRRGLGLEQLRRLAPAVAAR